MPESKELHTKVDEIGSYVKSMDGQLNWLVRAQANDLRPMILDFFKKRKRAAKVFLATDGKRTVEEIAAYLDLRQPNVSKELSDLHEAGLVECVEWGLYRKKIIDKILGLSRTLRKNPDLKDIR